MNPGRLRVGTAGWAIPRAHASAFPAEGSGLARYAARFSAAEINSTFHRPHRPATYARWADTVPDGFRFAVKLPKGITHERRLIEVEAPLAAFLTEIAALGDRLGPLLVQLPPSLAFEPRVAESFLRLLDASGRAELGREPRVVCEPRHAAWFTPDADALLRTLRVARVAADPARVPEAAEPGGWSGLVYHRLHGSPRMYRSAYEEPFLGALAASLATRAGIAGAGGGLDVPAETWCVFDNTASGAAAGNALELAARLEPVSVR